MLSSSSARQSSGSSSSSSSSSPFPPRMHVTGAPDQMLRSKAEEDLSLKVAAPNIDSESSSYRRTAPSLSQQLKSANGKRSRSIPISLVHMKKKARLGQSTEGILRALNNASYRKGADASDRLVSTDKPEAQLAALFKRFLMEQELLLRSQKHELQEWVKKEKTRLDVETINENASLAAEQTHGVQQDTARSSSSSGSSHARTGAVSEEPEEEGMVFSHHKQIFVKAKFQCPVCSKGFLQRKSFKDHVEKKICEGKGKLMSAARTKQGSAPTAPKPHISAFLLFLKDWNASNDVQKDNLAVTSTSSSSSNGSSPSNNTRSIPPAAAEQTERIVHKQNMLALASVAWKDLDPAMRKEYRQRNRFALEAWQRERGGFADKKSMIGVAKNSIEAVNLALELSPKKPAAGRGGDDEESSEEELGQRQDYEEEEEEEEDE